MVLQQFLWEVNQTFVALILKYSIIFLFFPTYPSVEVWILTDSDIGWTKTADRVKRILFFIYSTLLKEDADYFI